MRFKEIIQRSSVLLLTASVILLPYSISLCHFFLILFMLSSLLETNWETKLKHLIYNPIVIPFVLFLVLHLIGLTYSADREAGWFNLEKKAFLFVMPVVFAGSSPWKKAAVLRLFNLFIISCLSATFICLYLAFGRASGSEGLLQFGSLTSEEFYSPSVSNLWKLLTYGNLASGININPSYFSLYLAFCLILITHLHSKTFAGLSMVKKTGLLVMWLYLSVFIILLSSRIMILALLAINVVACYQLFGRKHPWKKIVASVSIVGMLCILIYLNPVSRYRSQEVIETPKSFVLESTHAQSVSIRASLWWLGIKSFQNVNPVWGAGTGDVANVMKQTAVQFHVFNILDSFNPHNQFLYTLIGLGGTGFLVLLACFITPAWLAWIRRDNLYLFFVFLFGLLCLSESALEFQKGIAFFSIFNSLLIFQYCNLQVPQLKKSLHG